MKRALLLVAAIAFGACSNSAATIAPASNNAPAASQAQPTASQAQATPAPTKQKITLSVMASQDWIKDSEKTLAQKFESQTGIHIDFQILPADQYFNVLKTKLNSGQGLDLFLGQAGKSDMKLQYQADVNAADLTNEEWAKRLDPVVADQSSLDGKLYGAEIWDVVAANYWVIVYNKEIFAKYKLSVPKTFAEFEAVCDTLKKNGVTPVYEPVSDGWHHVLWFPSVGGQLEALEQGLYDKLNKNQTTFVANANANKAISQLAELYQKGYFGSNALSAKEADTDKNMASGKFAMTLSELYRPAKTAAAYPNVKASTFGYFPIPILDNQLQPVHPAGPTWLVYGKSQHLAEAKQFLAFMMQPENLQWLIDNTPDFFTLPFTGLKAKWDADQTAFFSTYATAKTVVLQDGVNYVNPQWMDIGKDFTAMFTGKMKPADVSKAIDTRRTQQAKAAKDPAWP